MKIPIELKIGAHKYEVSFVDEIGERDDRFGHCFSRNLKIFIDNRVAQSQQEETMFHEAIHAMCEQLRLFPPTDQGNEDEERLVQSLGHAIFLFLKENNLLS